MWGAAGLPQWHHACRQPITRVVIYEQGLVGLALWTGVKFIVDNVKSGDLQRHFKAEKWCIWHLQGVKKALALLLTGSIL